jgi:hypothetical protein
VKKAIEDQETEQNFIMDMGAILRVMFVSTVNKWPSPEKVSETLSKFSSLITINLDTLASVDPNWDRSSRVRFLKHYERYDFLAPRKVHPNVQTFDHAIEALEHRFAVVVGQPVPTVHERMSMSKKKKPEKFDVKFGRMEAKLDWLLEHSGGPAEEQFLSRRETSYVGAYTRPLTTQPTGATVPGRTTSATKESDRREPSSNNSIIERKSVVV